MNIHENLVPKVDSLASLPAVALETAKQWMASDASRHRHAAQEFNTFMESEKPHHSEFDAEYGWYFPDARDDAEAGRKLAQTTVEDY